MHALLVLQFIYSKSQLEWIDVIDFIETQKRKEDMKHIDQKLDKGN